MGDAVVKSTVRMGDAVVKSTVHQQQPVYHQKEKNRSPISKAVMLTKVFESLPQHKDVFKKHVLGLILDYTAALEGYGNGNGNRRNRMDTSLKNALLPAVFALLNTISEFELQQLNTLLSTSTSKVLFRGIYQKYQTTLYKGQY
mmetsp:Transcript_355/g.416  ORF Transcript_355/g.416 Transcript_355/m.416 type:complete len:144 (-) Transcript_355:30-461(-)